MNEKKNLILLTEMENSPCPAALPPPHLGDLGDPSSGRPLQSTFSWPDNHQLEQLVTTIERLLR
jgi:hypothetical protein